MQIFCGHQRSVGMKNSGAGSMKQGRLPREMANRLNSWLTLAALFSAAIALRMGGIPGRQRTTSCP
eukprot:2553246-Rhodomonas_salina.2